MLTRHHVAGYGRVCLTWLTVVTCGIVWSAATDSYRSMVLLGRYSCRSIYVDRSIWYPCQYIHTVALVGILELSNRQYSCRPISVGYCRSISADSDSRHSCSVYCAFPYISVYYPCSRELCNYRKVYMSLTNLIWINHISFWYSCQGRIKNIHKSSITESYPMIVCIR